MPCRLLYQACKCIADFCGSSASALFECLRSVVYTSSSSQDKERAKIQLFKLLILPCVHALRSQPSLSLTRDSYDTKNKSVRAVKRRNT